MTDFFQFFNLPTYLKPLNWNLTNSYPLEELGGTIQRLRESYELHGANGGWKESFFFHLLEPKAQTVYYSLLTEIQVDFDIHDALWNGLSTEFDKFLKFFLYDSWLVLANQK